MSYIVEQRCHGPHMLGGEYRIQHLSLATMLAACEDGRSVRVCQEREGYFSYREHRATRGQW